MLLSVILVSGTNIDLSCESGFCSMLHLNTHYGHKSLNEALSAPCESLALQEPSKVYDHTLCLPI